MNPRNYDSDWDYQDAINPDAARFHAFVEREEEFSNLLRNNVDLVNENCWEEFTVETFALLKAFRSYGYRSAGISGWNLILDQSDDEDDDIPYLDSSPVLDIALFCKKDGMPDDLKQRCSEFRAKVLEASADWGWVFEKFIEQE